MAFRPLKVMCEMKNRVSAARKEHRSWIVAASCRPRIKKILLWAEQGALECVGDLLNMLLVDAKEACQGLGEIVS
jgi:hypothetical protein